MTDALATFMLARIAEEEEIARAATPGPWRNGLPATIHPDPTVYRTVTHDDEQVCGSIPASNAEHIACHDPARVLAECEVKRSLIAEYVESWRIAGALAATADIDPTVRGMLDGPHQWAFCMEKVVYTLTQVYRSHPDYRSEWAP